jgi:hypothetical protein
MKVGLRFSFSLASAMLVFLLCCSPGALGQGSDNRAGSSGMVLSHVSPALFVFAPQANLRDSKRRDRDNNNSNNDNNNNNKNGCSAQAASKTNNCTAVPEGGSAWAYLSLVALGCLATGIFMSRRQARATK